MLRDLNADTLELEARITDALIEMGSWEDVYVELYTRGVTGEPGHAECCPVAMWLESQVLDTVGVTPTWVMGYTSSDTTRTVSIPENVSDFIREFDAGKYPELVSADSVTGSTDSEDN